MEKVPHQAIITSALPYANGEIHIGHLASTYLPADITSRFLKLCGTKVYYICASDDFGTPILLESEKRGLKPSEYVAQWNDRDLNDFRNFNIDFDYFSSTSSSENIKFVQDVFNKLDSAGYIYKKNIIQYYCEKDSKFLPDRYVKGVCPECLSADQYSDHCDACGCIPKEILDPKCTICGNIPVRRESEHYFFRLSEFGIHVKEWLESNKNIQRDVTNHVKKWIENGIHDWDITRDINWGVPVPGETGKVFYGWFDNHLAYISSTLSFLDGIGIDGAKFWNNSTIYHFIGKDIIYHHCLLLPAIRNGINNEYKQPDFVPVRGHLKINSRKLSKSHNWYISLHDFHAVFPTDYLRFYLALTTPYSQSDVNFSWEDFAQRVNADLIDNIGNYINRILTFISKKYNGIVPEPSSFIDNDIIINDVINDTVVKTRNHLLYGNINHALSEITSLSSKLNAYFQECAPWKNTEHAATCIYNSVNAVYALSILIYPFIPNSALLIRRQLGLEKEENDQIQWKDLINLKIKPGHKIGEVSPLFKKIENAEIEKINRCGFNN